MRNCNPLISSLLCAVILCSCSIREDRAPCYGDPMLSVGPEELVLDVDEVEIVTADILTLSSKALALFAATEVVVPVSFPNTCLLADGHGEND